MSLSILEAQRNGLVNMLSLTSTENGASSLSRPHAGIRRGGTGMSEVTGGGAEWKVLVYDASGQDLLATLMKVGSLRQMGVTLHLHIDTPRSPVCEAPAVYLIEPTTSNLDRLAEDVQRQLYQSYYVNFTTPIQSVELEHMANRLIAVNGTQYISRVVDRYVGFVSFSPTEFSLNLPKSYQALHMTSASDKQIDLFVDKIVDGLMCAVVCLGVVPTLCCSSRPDSPAQMVARRLHDRIRQALTDQKAIGKKGLFSTAGRTSASHLRPSLILVDREIDLGVMLRHSWSYQPMVHDVLDMRLNRVTVPLGDGGADSKLKTYDLDSSDQFWATHCGSPFSEAAIAVSDALAELTRKMADLNAPQGSPAHPSLSSPEITTSLAHAMSALPEVTERKRSIDMHTNIATALVTAIKARGLDRCSEVEGQYEVQTVQQSTQIVKDQIVNSDATVADKTRALMCLYLAKPTMTLQQVTELRQLLVEAGGNNNTRPLDYLLHLDSLKSMSKELAEAQLDSSASAAQSSTYSSAFGDLGSRFIDRGRGLLQGVKNLLPVSRDLAISKITEALLDQRATSVTDKFLVLDPRSTSAEQRSVGRTGIVFVVGGGNFVESLAIKDLAKKSQKQIIYGSTHFATPAEFLTELSVLGVGA
eukprot:GHVN01092658.1.p1 GENE.GHVN01092658.1~~GHVN01092658.1.p1  ORF type:complete len:644 (-),score=112.77 GHVN01092658.1:42-1973(-)